ncbi:MAG: hypothetical protein L6R42_005440 [Xanthoria sp. 1 TBL-2021]|nr:MAG: hypothetical protein L6R42_005440 [Xanthoria sp. 1 TBL-2021]
MFSSAAIVDFLLRTAEPLPEIDRPASALPWAPPTWQSGRQEDQASEPDTKDTQSETAAQAALPCPRPAEDAVSSEDEEVSVESANVDLGYPDTQHESFHPRKSITTETNDVQGHEKPSLKATKTIKPVSTPIREDVPYQGPLILDGGDCDVQENPVPLKTDNGPDVHRGRTATRQAGPDVQRGRTPMRQAGPDEHRGQTPMRQAFYAQPGNFIPSMIGKISGTRGFRAFIVSDPMEEDVIFRDFLEYQELGSCRHQILPTFLDDFYNINPAHSANGLLQELDNIYCARSVYDQRLPLTTEEYGHCYRWVFTHESMMAIIAQQKTTTRIDCCDFHTPVKPNLRYCRG